MPIDASIYSQFAPKVPSPLDVQNALAQTAANQLGMQHTRMQLQQMQADQADTNALREAYRSGVDPTTPEGRAALIKAAPLQAPKIFQQQADYNKTLAETNKNNAQGEKAKTETDAQKLELASRDWAGLDPHDDHAFAGVLAKQVKLGNITPEDATAYGDKLTKMTPDERQREYYQQGLKGLDMKAQAELKQKQTEEAGRNARNAADIAGRAATNAATNATSYGVANIHERGQNTRQAETLKKDYTIAGLNPDGTTPALPEGGVLPRVHDAAVRFNLTGELPTNLGRGTQGAVEMRQIRDEASRLTAASGMTPEQRAEQQGTGKRTLASFAPGGKDGQAVESANIGLNHLATLRQLAAAQKNGDIPLFNSIANRMAKELGQPAPTNLQGAITMVGPEITKAVVGAGGGVEDRKKTDDALAAMSKGSPAQAEGQAATMEDLFGGRLMEKQRSYERGAGLKDFTEPGRFLSPAAAAVLARRSGAGSGVPSDIDAILKKHSKPGAK